MKRYIYFFIAKLFLAGCSNYNTLDVRRKCRTKQQARQIFTKLGIPSVPSLLFYNPYKVFSFVKKHGFPVIIKPNVSGFSRGAYFPIFNYYKLLLASFAVKVWWPSSIIESYIVGGNYRVVVVKNDIMAAIIRYGPFVVGNGVDAIAKLIDKENTLRDNMGILPVMHHIPKNTKVKKYLKKQGLTLGSILQNKDKIYLYNKVALSTGGIVQTIAKSEISQKNKGMLFNLLASLSANILGVDIIAKEGLSVDFNKQECTFLELNSRPFIKMHENPRYGEKPDLSKYYHMLNSQEVLNDDIY